MKLLNRLHKLACPLTHVWHLYDSAPKPKIIVLERATEKTVELIEVLLISACDFYLYGNLEFIKGEFCIAHCQVNKTKPVSYRLLVICFFSLGTAN